MLMGTNKENGDAQRLLMVSVACFGSVLVSVTGGLILGWWVNEFHPTNRQLWMVPLGLVLFATPLIVWLALLVSDICNWKNGLVQIRSNQLVPSPDDSIPDPER